MIKIYIAEDQSLLNSALTQLLNLEDDFQVVGNAVDGAKAWQDLQVLKPDVVILDIEMPKMTGLEVALQVNKKNLQEKVIILTTFAQKAYFEQAVLANVSGYLLKDSPSEELIAAIRDVSAGKTIFAPELVVDMISAENNPLSTRELEILKVAESGITTKQIAQQLFLSEGTVRNYLSAVFSKLGVHNRIEAIKVVKKNKWL
ncbi:DNA-binding response regulator [Liquorilactobacillus hordei]|uniref:Response regulator n=1 Tax=Liquorilactobacillus hordei DSM 19519 TaxID=1423759 RepID=A0A0R1MGK9_9LACO|nr:response regulator transcription factor [Liquorilactobacillus hordei]KRL06977.1 response regulator [Liquorilactobacillus hordei DSM 19519]QYH51662.1 response regulator transcription factor [Liquorilactobacillus hordei DSM 19519]